MKRNALLIIIFFVSLMQIRAQNDTMYIMREGAIIGKFNLYNQVDSVIFYYPNTIESFSITDIDGNIIPTVVIGSQIWTAANLKVTKLNDGTAIPLVADDSIWNNSIAPGYCWYNNDKAMYGNTYGALYNWYTVNTGKLCPSGWHIPAKEEWVILSEYLGGDSISGGKLKEAGGNHWEFPNEGAINSTGFTARPAGFRNYDGIFFNIGKDVTWWSADQFDSEQAWYSGVNYMMSSFSSFYNFKLRGYSVRCLRD